MSRLLPILILILFLISCEESDVKLSSPMMFADTTITLTVGVKVVVPGTNVTLTMDSLLYDRRLPQGETASEWHNTAEVNIAVGPGLRNLHLDISGEITAGDSVYFYGLPATLDSFQYQILKLEPLPLKLLSPPPDSELVATVRVSRAPVPSHYEEGFFPIVAGNRWIYAETCYQRGVPFSLRFDTIEVIYEYYDAYGRWGRLSHWTRPLNGEVLVRGDSIFSLQSAGIPMPPGYPQGFISMELIRARETAFEYQALFDGDLVFKRKVALIDTAIVTPVGTFTEAYEYSGTSSWSEEYQVLVPGIGFVYMEYGGDPSPEPYNVCFRIGLIECALVGK